MNKPRKLFTRKYFYTEINSAENFPDYGTCKESPKPVLSFGTD